MLAALSDCPKLNVKLSQVYLPMLYGTQENEKKVIKILILISIIKMTSCGTVSYYLNLPETLLLKLHVCHFLSFSDYFWKYRIASSL